MRKSALVLLGVLLCSLAFAGTSPAEASDLSLKAGESHVFDFGPDGVGGYPTVTFAGTEGTARVRLAYATHPDGLGPKGDFWHETRANYMGPGLWLPILPASTDRFDVFEQTGAGAWRAPLAQGLVRYAKLTVESGAATVRDVRFANDGIHSEEPVVGSFCCSDERVNGVWRASVRTCQLAAIPARTKPLAVRGVHTNAVLGTAYAYLSDGAKRDRLVWSGDLWFAQGNMYAAFASDSPYMPGSIRMLAENRTPDGYVQACPFPESHGPLKAGDYGPFASDEFAAWFIPVLCDHVLHTGDLNLAREMRGVVRDLVAYLDRHTAKDGIFEQRLETCKHSCGLAVGGTSLHHRSYMNILNWLACRDAARLAAWLGDAADAAARTALADRTARAVRREFWDAEKGHFRLSREERGMGFEANALALAAEFATAEEASRILPQLTRNWHGKFQLLAIRGAFACGQGEKALALIAAHNWYKYLDPEWKGLRTVQECCNLTTKGWGDEAHPDACLAGALTEGLLGVRPLEPGYRTFAVTPHPTASVTSASGSVPTPYGPIKVSWRLGKKGVELTVHNPPGTRRVEEVTAKWICYPGDLGVYLGEKVQARRPEWNGYTPVMWPQYHHWTVVEFARDVDLAEPEEVEVRVCGTGHLLVPGVRHPFTFDRDRVTLPKGRYRLSAKVYNAEKPPALFVDGPTVKTGAGWSASWDGVEWRPASADGDFTSKDLPPGDFCLKREHRDPVKVVREGKTLLADFGRETFGYLKFRGVKGRGRIKIVWAESEAEAHAEPLKDLPFGEDVTDVWETIELSEADEFVYEKSRGFRYVRFAPVEGDVAVDSVAMDCECLPLVRRGSFHCNDERLNRIWEVGAYTLGLTMREVMVEGLKRDRWCWSGDAYQSFLMNYYLFADAGSVRRTLWALRGKEPVRRHVNTIMDYSFFWFAAVKDYYLFTGDRAFLEEIYPAMVSQMDFCLGRLDANGMAVFKPGDWVFVDWAPKPLDNNSGPVAFEQIMLVRGLEAIAECASVCGKVAAAKAYADRATALRAKILPTFWDAAQGGLVHNLGKDGKPVPTVTRYANMFGILYGYFDAVQTSRVVKDVLQNDNVMAIQTPYMRYYELEALCKAGLQAKVTDEIRSYWGAMLDLGATTFWELYNPKEKGAEHYAMYGRPFGKSLCHAWGASPLYLLGRYYLGVQPTRPGFAAYDVSPSLGGLKTMEGAVPTPTGPVKVVVRDGRCTVTGNGGTGTLRWNGRTAVVPPYGTISVAWRLEDGKVVLDVKAPKGTEEVR